MQVSQRVSGSSCNLRKGAVLGVLGAALFAQSLPAFSYELSGGSWSNKTITESHCPDGTKCDDGVTPSKQFEALSALTPALWQREYAIALQKWAAVSPLNFRLVSDSGVATGTSGATQGDTRFGDTRSCGLERADSFLAYAYYPGGSTLSGDTFLNTRYQWNTGSGGGYRLMGVMIHEFGHSLGLAHSTDTAACMYPYYVGYLDLGPDDIAGIRAIYGSRQPDSYDSGGGNNTTSTATTLSTSASPSTVTADITTLSDVDCYKATMPASGALSAKVQVSTRSLLAPKLMIYDTSGALMGSATGDYGKDITVSLPSVTQGSTYYITVMGDTANAVPAIGVYDLQVTLPGTSSTPEPTPEPTPTPTPKPRKSPPGKNK